MMYISSFCCWSPCFSSPSEAPGPCVVCVKPLAGCWTRPCSFCYFLWVLAAIAFSKHTSYPSRARRVSVLGCVLKLLAGPLLDCVGRTLPPSSWASLDSAPFPQASDALLPTWLLRAPLKLATGLSSCTLLSSGRSKICVWATSCESRRCFFACWTMASIFPMQKEKLQLPLNGSLPLSGTQKPTVAPLRGEKAVAGRKPTHALTAER
ncbi:hypothetical protein LR48_Vigan07g107800 [Vigna angularis]|uniref:Uncharacterized protein n=1 Tax=Phaseolus angularis TaxID=3914 RepID=A0A0L9UXU9_PHAAN|nr:hypothetical protein LR48_Vigan07g107800 [Vigna angularis]